VTLTALIGPPGTGKTTAIAREINEAITVEGLPPDRLMALTFTRAAAEQLRTRCQLPKKRGRTLHSLALAAVTDGIGYRPALVQLDDADRRGVTLDDAAEPEGDGDGPAAKVPSWPEWLAREALPHQWGQPHGIEALDVARARCTPRDEWDAGLVALDAAWTRYKAAHELWDFADLIDGLADLHPTAPPFETWKIWVDEAQDLTIAEARLVRAWAGVCDVRLIGDDDQAIYGWRGSDPRESLGAVEPEYTTILTQSYRCPARISDAAQAFMERATWRVAKHWEPRPDDDGRIMSWDTWTHEEVLCLAERKAHAGASVLLLAHQTWSLTAWGRDRPAARHRPRHGERDTVALVAVCIGEGATRWLTGAMPPRRRPHATGCRGWRLPRSTCGPPHSRGHGATSSPTTPRKGSRSTTSQRSPSATSTRPRRGAGGSPR
jgi:superfamily I DNA/RNA helicase